MNLRAWLIAAAGIAAFLFPASSGAAQLVVIDFNRSESDGTISRVTNGRLEQTVSDPTLLSGLLTHTFTYDDGNTTETFVVTAQVIVNALFLNGPVVSAVGTISGQQVNPPDQSAPECGNPTVTYSGTISGGSYLPNSSSAGTLFLTGTRVDSYANFHRLDAAGEVTCVSFEQTQTGNMISLRGAHVFASDITVSIGDAVELEGGPGSSNALSFPVTLSAPAPAGGVSVNYATSDITTQAGTDYQVTAGTLSFLAGETATTVVVPINGDPDVEADETLTVTLSAPVGATIADGTGTGTILNDDLSAVDFDWTMPDRFGLDANSNSLIDYFTTAAAISPASWRVDFTYGVGGNCDPSHRLLIKIDGVIVVLNDPALIFVDTSTCRAAHAFADEGVYEVSFQLLDAGGNVVGTAIHDVTVQDWLIVSLGDSVASGEGNPDIPGASPQWENRQCHRSAAAGPAQAALAIERADPKTSVTFVHLACSGASVFEGILARYRGQEPGPWIPPQVDQMDTLVGSREIDAVTLSAGANDVRFSTVVTGCFLQRDCHLASTPGSMLAFFNGWLPLLPGNYDALALTLRQPRYDVPSARTYITEYYDALRDDAGAFCDQVILEENRNLPILGISGAESQWASTDMMVRLNQQVAAGAGRNGWRYVGGMYSAFQNHGYCAAGRWIVQLTESFAQQRNPDGTIHPNELGHAFYGSQLAASLTADLYTGGDLTMPRPPQ